MAALMAVNLYYIADRVVFACLVTGSLALLCYLIVVVADYLDGWSRRRALGDIPILDGGNKFSRLLRRNQSDLEHAKEYAKGYNQYIKAGKPYATKMQHDDYVVVLPQNAFKEYRNLPYDRVSFLHALEQLIDSKLHFNVITRLPIEALQSCNNEATLKNFHDLIVQEIDKYMPLVFSRKDSKQKEQADWKEYSTGDAIFSICSNVAMSVIVGPEFGADQTLVDETVSVADTMEISRYTRTGSPRILRPLIWRFMPLFRGLRAKHAMYYARLAPEVQRRIDNVRMGQAKTDDDRPFTLLDSLINVAFKNGTLNRNEKNADEDEVVYLLVQVVVLFHLELTRPISANVTFQIFSILDHPEYIDPLRQEITDGLKALGGNWTSEMIKLTPKLESFARETFRMHEIGAFVGIRRVMKPLTLKTLDLSLKPGTLIVTPSVIAQRDPDNYPAAATFDGYRFYDACNGTCTPRLTTATSTFLVFSQGISTCPGRFLSAHMLRTIFMKFLLQHDMEPPQKEKLQAYGLPSLGFIYNPNRSVVMRVRPRHSTD
ncbi:hypothetical protein P175DRAFT_0427971 [Aspergillus ochraceoroseus IBT 24754]|uniref:Cytochrome P450 n=1 Tax=Aspergillus ochraceoroseus IBT 24754 TaxID=1392256 RepID=A0A2T5M9S0_9EURO|nr:uncharacterized protein P175DRAFT_0427971 [Aspergillus ochraceoroseus IBT 24754]PTU25283.1 hypothetical protein P175DRAFT_0427971 [Aspergillus ochraceoroseus IBT 24754]